MTYELYRYIFIGGLALSIVMFIATVLIFIFLDIRNAIGDITGSNKRKGVENIHNQTTSSAPKKRVVAKRDESNSQSTQTTAKIKTQDRYDNFETDQTTVLVQTEEQVAQTTVLGKNSAENVDVKAQDQQPVQEHITEEMVVNNPNFKIEIDITYVHSNEIIK